MISDFRLEELRKEKRKQNKTITPAVEVAMRLTESDSTAEQVRKALSPFIDLLGETENASAVNTDPLKETLKANGFITEE